MLPTGLNVLRQCTPPIFFLRYRHITFLFVFCFWCFCVVHTHFHHKMLVEELRLKFLLGSTQWLNAITCSSARSVVCIWQISGRGDLSRLKESSIHPNARWGYDVNGRYCVHIKCLLHNSEGRLKEGVSPFTQTSVGVVIDTHPHSGLPFAFYILCFSDSDYTFLVGDQVC